MHSYNTATLVFSLLKYIIDELPTTQKLGCFLISCQFAVNILLDQRNK